MSDAVIPYAAPQVTRKDFDAYCEQVPSFEASEFEAAKRGSRRGFLGTVGFAGLSAVMGVALAKTAQENTKLAKGWEVRPVLVDKTTGESFQISKVEALPPDAVEAHTKHMAWLYVSTREGYSAPEDLRRFEDVVAMSDRGEQVRFKRWWEEEADGPRKELTRAGFATFRSRALPVLLRDDPKDTKGPFTHFTYSFARTLNRPRYETTTVNMKATVFFGWDEGYARSDDRLVNPFGFVVYRYMRSWENA